MSDPETLGRRLRKFRYMQGGPKTVFADRIGLELGLLSKRERGKTRVTANDMIGIRAAYPSFDFEQFLTGGAYD